MKLYEKILKNDVSEELMDKHFSKINGLCIVPIIDHVDTSNIVLLSGYSITDANNIHYGVILLKIIVGISTDIGVEIKPMAPSGDLGNLIENLVRYLKSEFYDILTSEIGG